MSGPETVPIFIRPRAMDQSLMFHWYPVSTGMEFVSSFNIRVTGSDDDVTVGIEPNRTYYTISNLDNSQSYTGSIYQIDTSEVSSIATTYRTVIPGFKPGAPQNVSYTRISENRVAVTWEPPNSNGDATIFWYMLKDTENPTMRLPAKHYYRGVLTPELSTGTHQLYLQAINDPGYGTKTLLPTFTTPFISQLYNFALRETINNSYTYRMLNTALNKFSSSTPFGYDTSYSLAITPQASSEVYVYGFSKNGVMNLVFVRYIGAIVQTLSFPTTSYTTIQTKKFTAVVYLESNVWKYANYDYDGNTLRTATLSYTNGSSISLFQKYRNYGYLVMYNGSTGDYDHYVVNATDSTPYSLFSTTGNYTWKAAQSGYISVIHQTGTGAYTTFKQARPDRTTRSYTFMETAYNTVTQFNQFGIDNVMTECILDTGSRRDILIFDGRTSNAPALASGIGNNYSISKFQSEADATGKSNHYAFGKFIPQMNNINDGGGDMYDGGNYVSVDATDNTTPFAVTDGNYGTLVDNTSYGYFISAANTWPHAAAVKITSGEAKLLVRGDTGSDTGGSVLNYNGTYTCANGRTGSYWMNVNYDTFDPTIGDLWFTIELPAWGTSGITKTADTRKTSDTNNYNHYITVSGSNFIFVKLLLSKWANAMPKNDKIIVQADLEAFLEDYVQAADLGATFATVSLTDFYDWHMANATTIYSTMPSYYLYTYDGGNNSARFFENYYYNVLLDGQTSFTSTNFLGGDVAISTACLNASGVGIPWNDGTNYNIRVITSAGITNTTLRNSITGYTNSFTIVQLDVYFFHYMYNTSTGQYDWYFVRSSDAGLVNDGSANGNTYVSSGDRVIFQSGNNLFSYFIYGGLVNINEYGFILKNTSFDDGSNTIVFYRNDTSANNVSLLTPANWFRQTINRNPAGSAARSASETGVIFVYNSPFSLRVVYPTSTYSYNDSDSAIQYNSSILKTDQSWAVYVFNNISGAQGYASFTLDTELFTRTMVSGSQALVTNYLYV